MAFASHSSPSTPVDSANFIQKKVKYNALSQIPVGVIVEEDISAYIDCKLEHLGSLAIHSQVGLIYGDDKKIKLEYSILEEETTQSSLFS